MVAAPRENGKAEKRMAVDADSNDGFVEMDAPRMGDGERGFGTAG